MQSLFEFLLEEAPKTDNAIYYRLGKNKYAWVSKRTDRREPVDRKYGHDRKGLIKYAKDEMPKILPNEKEVIHRKDWDLNGLIGETEKQLLHPSYWNINEYIAKNHKRKHDILTIFECSSAKPYSTSPMLLRFLRRFSGVSDFACISNPGIIPMEYSHFYPYRYDEWDHFEEKEDIACKYCQVNIGRLLKYKKDLGYKHVLVLIQHPAPQKSIDIMYNKDIDGCKDWLHIVSDANFRRTIKNKYYTKFNSNMGLLYTRTMGTKYAMEAYMRELNKYAEGKERDVFNDVKKMMKEYEGATLDNHIKEYNKEHDIEMIDLEMGAKESWKMLTPNDTKQELVSKFNSHVKKFVDDLDTESTENLHKNHVYFTVLDMLNDYYKDPDYIEDPDVQYWSMKKALDDCKELDCTNEFVYYKKSLLDKLHLKEKDIIKDADELGITQTNDKRKKRYKENSK